MLPSRLWNNPHRQGRVAVLHLLFYCISARARPNQVLVPQKVNAVLGENVTLECQVEVGTNVSLTQSSWERRLPTGAITVAVYNPVFGVSVPPEFSGRVTFRSPSSHDATILLTDMGIADMGVYTCKATTFPLGITQASTTVNVLVPPSTHQRVPGVGVGGALSLLLVLSVGGVCYLRRRQRNASALDELRPPKAARDRDGVQEEWGAQNVDGPRDATPAERQPPPRPPLPPSAKPLGNYWRVDGRGSASPTGAARSPYWRVDRRGSASPTGAARSPYWREDRRGSVSPTGTARSSLGGSGTSDTALWDSQSETRLPRDLAYY